MGWAERYRPETLEDVYGNDKAVSELESWASNWSVGDSAVLLYGPPGVGKTTATYALAQDMGWDVVEMNASDKRTRSRIEETAGSAAQNTSLTGAKRRLVVVDEADNLHGNYDRGGSKALSEIVDETKQPIILLANDLYEMSRSLRNKCKQIEFDYVEKSEISKALRDICRLQEIEYDIKTLKKIAGHADGDVRSAINDLQALASGKDSITDVEIVTGERKQEIGIFPFLDNLFKTNTAEESAEQARIVDESPDSLIRWIDENVFKTFSKQEVADAYTFLSKADVWLGRTRTTQEYRFWRYASATMTAGVSSARSESKRGWTRYSPPKWLSKDSTKEEIARKIGVKSGTSTQTAFSSIIPFLSVMTHHCKNRGLTVRMAAYYDFDESEVAAVTGSGKTTNKVEDIVSDAQELQTENAESFFAINVEDSSLNEEDEGEDESSIETEETKENTDQNEKADVDVNDSEEETEDNGDDNGQTGLNEFM